MAFSPGALPAWQELRTYHLCSQRASGRNPCILCPSRSSRREHALRRSPDISRGGRRSLSSGLALGRVSYSDFRLPQPYPVPHNLTVALLAFQSKRRLLGGFGRPDQLGELLTSITALPPCLSPRSPRAGALLASFVEGDGVHCVLVTPGAVRADLLREFQPLTEADCPRFLSCF